MKTADIEVGKYYAYTTYIQRNRNQLGDYLEWNVSKVKVTAKGQERRGRRFGLPTNDGVVIKFTEKRMKGESAVVAPRNILGTWEDYVQARKEDKEWRERNARIRDQQNADKRAYLKRIKEALEAKGFASSDYSGDFYYSEYEDGTTRLDVPLGTVAKLLGVETDEDES